MRIPLYYRTDVARKFKYTPGIHPDYLTDRYYLPHPEPEFYLGVSPGESFESVFKDYDFVYDSSYYFPIIVSLSDVLSVLEYIEIPLDVLCDLKIKKCKFLICCPYEGWDWRFFRKFSDILISKYKDLSLDDFVFLTGNYNNQEDLNQVYFNCFERNIEHRPIVAYRHRGCQEISTKRKKPYKFICLNRRPAMQRMAVVTELFDYKDNALISLGTKGHAGTAPEYFENEVLNFQQNYPRLGKIWRDKKIGQKLPLVINDGIDASKENPVVDDSIDKFYNSYIHVVTETFGHYKHDRLFFSEKVYKPMMFLQPFILIGEPFALKALKEFGYKTFSDFWDESYDEILHDGDRLFAATEIIKNLANKSDNELSDMLDKMLPILNHNFGNLLYRAHTMDLNLRQDLAKFIPPVTLTNIEREALRVQRKKYKRLRKQGRKD